MVGFAGCCRVPAPLLAVILSISGGATWATPHPDDSVSVVVGDLNFSSARDVELFTRRVDKAARTLCTRRSQLDFYEMNACYRAVRRQCVRKLSDSQRRELLATSSKIRKWGYAR